MKMRLLVWTIVPILIGLSYYIARTNDGYRWLTLASSPALECPASLELGERELGEVALARFTIANRGGKELVIDEIESNCACSGLERETDGKFVRLTSLRLAPYERTNLTMRVLVQGAPGSATQNGVSFRTNDPTCATMHIDAHVSKITAGVTTVPTSIVLGTLRTTSESRKLMAVYDNAVRPRKIARVVSLDPARVAVRLLDRGATDAAENELGTLIGQIEVEAGTSLPGSLNTEIAIHLENVHRPPTIVPVIGRVVGPIELSPTMLVFPRMSDGHRVFVRNCLCRSTTDKSIRLVIESVPDEFTATISATENATEQLITVECKRDNEGHAARPGKYTLRLRAILDSEEVPFEISVLCLPKANDP